MFAEKIIKGEITSPEALSKETEQFEDETIENIKDDLFDSYMLQRLTQNFFENLEDYLDVKDIDEMRGVLAMQDDDDIYAALSLPHELCERKFSQFEKALDEGTSTPTELITELINVSKKHSFSIGYHTSPNDIKPDKNGRWSIKGTEKDHRDNDNVMAYYSRHYRHLFKKKGPKFVYIVRTEPGSHKTDGNWSRASELSIVAAVPFEDVFHFVERTASQIEKKKDGS